MKQVHRGGGRELCFPKTVSEAQRQALEKQVAGLNHDNAQQVLDELAGCMASKQIHNPIRYCAALVARLRRGRFQPELCLQVADRRAAEQQREARRLCSAAATRRTRDASARTARGGSRAGGTHARGVAKSYVPATILAATNRSILRPRNGRTDVESPSIVWHAACGRAAVVASIAVRSTRRFECNETAAMRVVFRASASLVA